MMVTTEEAKRMLRDVHAHQQHADNIRQQMDTLRDSLGIRGTDYSRDKVQTSGTGDRMADVFARLDELEVKLLDAMRKHIEYMFLVMEIVERLEPEESYLLNLRYFQFVPFEKLPGACEAVMQYSDRHIWRMLSKATRHFAEAVSREDVIKMSRIAEL